MSFTRTDLNAALERIDQFDSETQAQLKKLDRMVPARRLDTSRMYAAMKGGSLNTPSKRRSFAALYMQESFGMSGSIQAVTRGAFGKELSDDQAFEWVSGMLEARHGESKLKTFRSSSEEEKKRPLEKRMKRTRTIARLFGPTSYGDWSVSAGDVADYERELESKDFATQVRRLESVLTPEQEKVGRFLAVAAEPMEGVAAIHAMPEQDRGNVLAYIALLNPERNVGFWGQIAPRLRDAGKRSIFAVRRSVENFEDRETALSPSGVYRVLSGKFPGGQLPDGTPLFSEKGGFASDKSRAAVRAALLKELWKTQFQPSEMMSYNMIKERKNKGDMSTQLDNYMDQVPAAFNTGRDGWELRGIERGMFHGAELDRFKKTPGEPALQAMEMLVDMGAALVASAAVQSPAGGIAYSYARVQSTLQDQLEYDYGVDHNKAFWFASVASAPYAAVEYAQISGLKGAAQPAQKRFLQYASRNWKGLLADTMKQHGITTLREIGEESAQSLIEQTMKAAAKEFAGAEGVDYTDLLGNWFDETVQAAKVMPFVMFPSVAMDVSALEIAKRGMKPGDPALLHEIETRLEKAKEQSGQSEPDAQLTADIQALEKAYHQEQQQIYEADREQSGDRGDVTTEARGIDFAIVEAMQQRAKGAAPLVVVERQEDLPRKVREDLEAVHGEGSRASGWFHGDTIYLVRENLDSEESAAVGWGHEQGHAAVESLGNMQDLLIAGIADLSGGVERIRELTHAPETMSDGDVVHEYIADLAAKQIDSKKGGLTGPQQQVWKAAVEWAQDWLGITTQTMLNDREVALIVRGIMERVFRRPRSAWPSGVQLDSREGTNQATTPNPEDFYNLESIPGIENIPESVINAAQAWRKSEKDMRRNQRQGQGDEYAIAAEREKAQAAFYEATENSNITQEQYDALMSHIHALESHQPAAKDLHFSADQNFTERESVVSVALRRLAGDDFSGQLTGREMVLDRPQDNVVAFLNKHFPGTNIPETIRRANEVVRMVESRADLLEMEQSEINRAVRQAEYDVRYAVQTAGIEGRIDRPAASRRESAVDEALIHNRGERIRSLQGELRQRQQEIKRMERDAKRTLAGELKNQRLDIRQKMAAIDEYIRLKTPAGASEIMKDAAAKARRKMQQLLSVAKAETRARRVGEIVADIDRIFTEAERRDAIAGIEDVLKNRVPKVDKRSKILKGGTLSPDQHEALAFVREAWKVRDVALSSAKVWELQGELEGMNQELDVQENAPAADEKKVVRLIRQRDRKARELWAWENFSDINGRSRSLAHVIRASKELTDLIRDGKTIHELEMRMFREERDRDRLAAFEEFGGGRGYGTSATSRRKRSYDRNTPEWLKALNTFDSFHQSFEFLLDKFDQSGAGILGGVISRKYGRLTHQATVKKDRLVRQQIEKVTAAAMRIFGVDSKKAVARLFAENSREQDQTGVFQYNKEGEREQMVLSRNQAYKLWQLFQDETLADALEANGYTPETEKQLGKFIGPKVLEWARWQIEEFYPEFYHTINPVYRKLFMVNMPFTKNYSPVYRHLSGRDVAEMDPQQRAAETRRAVTNMSVKARVANLRDFELIDGDAVLMMHIDNMSHFVAWAEPLRLMNGVFRDAEVAEVIREHHGVKSLQALNTQLNHFAAGGVDSMVTMRALDRFRSRFTKAVIGMKPPILLKQLTSIPAYAMDMPAGAWAKGEAAFFKNPKKAIKTLMDSDFMKDRYKKGHERDVILALHSSIPKTLAGARSFTDKLMVLTQLGDAGAILAGGYPVYLHHYNLAKKAGKSDYLAKKEGLLQFELATRRTQQSGDVMDLGHFQRGGSIQKLLTMFSTSPISYYRSVSAGVRELARTKGKSAEAWKRVVVGHFLLPMLFQFVANGFRWDEEDQIRAALLGSMNRLFIAGDIMNAVAAAIISNDIRAASNITATPFGDIGTDVVYAVNRLVRELDEGDMDMGDLLYVADHLAEAAGKTSGIPYEGGRNIVNGVIDAATGETEYPLRRSIGYTPYALDE